jgi:hypothetical protein
MRDIISSWGLFYNTFPVTVSLPLPFLGCLPVAFPLPFPFPILCTLPLPSSFLTALRVVLTLAVVIAIAIARTAPFPAQPSGIRQVLIIIILADYLIPIQ